MNAETMNYCAHAIDDLREFENMLRSEAPESARVLRRVIEMLQHSVKFLLPNCCNLIDPEDLGQAHLDLTRLPFRCVAFETPWNAEDDAVQLGEFQQSLATKRIALCWEASPEYELLPGLNSILNVAPEGGIFVVPLFWGPELRRWQVGIGGTFVPYVNEVRTISLEDSLPASRIANQAAIQAGLAKSSSKQFRAEPFYLLPELYEQTLALHGGDREKTYAQIMLDARDEVQTVIQACSVINCANVIAADVPAAAKLNKKREKSGKQPFFSYKILQLADERRMAKRGGSMESDQASVRMHLRRGHLRRLDGKVIWVRPAMVNAGSKIGAVLKDYAVSSTPAIVQRSDEPMASRADLADLDQPS